MALRTLNTADIDCGKCYVLYVTASNYVSGTVTLTYGYTDNFWNYTQVGTLGTITADGDFTFNVDVFGASVIPTWVCQAGQTSHFAIQYNDDADVDLVFSKFILDPTCDTERLISDCYELSDCCDCTLLLTWTNDKDAFGFNYNDFDFVQSLRIDGRKWFSRYPEVNNQYTGSRGTTTIVSASNYEVEEVQTDELPKWAHNAIRLARINRTFNINGEQYVALQQDYEPDWDAYRKWATANFEVRKKTEYNENNNC